MSSQERPSEPLEAARALINRYDPCGDPGQQEAKEAIGELLARGSGVLHRSCTEPGHITASSWIQSPCGLSVLLCLHRRLNRWLQLGGHVDGESDLVGAAMREAREESGIAEFDLVTPEVFDLDIHSIPARSDEPAHHHFDVRFLLRARSSNLICSSESLDLRWVPMEKIALLTDEISILRMAEKSRTFFPRVDSDYPSSCSIGRAQ